MYRYFNANILGNFVDDCAIRAISLAEGKTWDETYDKLSDLAQQKGTMMDNKYFIRDYLDSKYKRVKIKGTVGEVANDFNNSICLITMSGHITCSVYGIIYDSFDCRNRKAEYLWIIKD